MSFFNTNGHDSIVAGLDLEFVLSLEAADEERSMRTWVSVEELAIDFDFEDRMIAAIDGDDYLDEDFDVDLEMTIQSSPLLGSDYHDELDEVDEWPRSDMSEDEMDRLSARVAAEQLEEELSAADSFMPAFSSNRERFNPYNLSRDDIFFKSKRRAVNQKARKKAKFRIDDKLARRDNRNNRFGNRQEFAQMRDDWADRYDAYAELYLEWNAPAVPVFDIKLVGLTDEEASSYEAECQREIEAFEYELEQQWWDESEPDDSHHFDQVKNTGMAQEAWERFYFPERFEDFRLYRFFSDYWDDYDPYTYDDDYRMVSDDYDDRYYDEPEYVTTSEDWEEIDRLEDERAQDEEADRFSPSFVGSGRSTLRYHISEPRRGKLKRKYGGSTSFLYRNGRPFVQSAAH